MDDMHWPLTLLSRAINYKNLTHAAANIGISQPQLSRVIGKLEEEFSVVLLDRESKRKSSWTIEAQKLGTLYSSHSKNLQKSIESLLKDNYPKEISVGILEGLIDISSKICHKLLSETDLEKISLNVYDLSELQDRFSKGELDLVLTSTISGAKKQNRIINLGYQTLDHSSHEKAELHIISPYEEATLKTKPKDIKTLVSNSLATRKYWLNNYRGSGQMPSVVSDKKTSDSIPVYLFGHEQINSKLWQKVQSLNTTIH